jgi:protein involved in polysaccharide export with SLBB domain
MKASELISVSIDGNIKNPGTYNVSRGTLLQELYIIAGGLLGGASERGIVVQRKSLQEREVKSLKDARRIIINSLIASGNDGSDQAISFLNLLDQEVEEEFLGRISGDFSFGSKGANSLVLSEEDKIFIPNFTNTVSVLGEVLTPTSFIFEERKNINYYINQSGGFSNIADKGKIYIVGANGVSSSAQLTLFNRGYSPQPGDIIIVPKKLNRFQLTPAIAAATQILSNLAFASASLNAIQNQ